MATPFLSQFRRQLFEWLQVRIGGGRLPFRRVEEAPAVLTGSGPMTPDLVIWINRDSLLAGAMILIPAKADSTLLQDGGVVAGSLGLRQFVTWEAQTVNIWDTDTTPPRLLKSWPMPASRAISADDFAVTFEQLLLELKNLAVSAVLPAGQLPPAYFANLCLQTLRDIEPALQEAARVAAASGQPDSVILQHAGDKGWLTLWRLLALLRHDRMPTGIRPERLDRALDYAVAELIREGYPELVPSDGESPLPESAAIRLHHLAGRLAQLGWHQQPDRADASLGQLFAQVARERGLATALLQEPPGTDDLLVNHIPPQPLAGSLLVAPQVCLAGWRLAAADNRPARAYTDVAALPVDIRPARIVASLDESRPLTAPQRRRRLASLRQPWPYRRFRLAADTPAWLWDALYLAGMTDTDGTLQLTLPVGWSSTPGTEQLWPLLTERLTLAMLRVHSDGRHTMTLTGHDQAPEMLTLCFADGSCRQVPLLLENVPPEDVTALASATAPPRVPLPPGKRKTPAQVERIVARVFQDGLPRFPDDYLRRIDLPPLRSYQLPGPLRIDSHFFDRVQLSGPDGARVESANPADAEALLLASRDGRSRVDLPADPTITEQLTTAYREDLHRLWRTLLAECRRHHPAQKRAMALARRLWKDQGLPPLESL